MKSLRINAGKADKITFRFICWICRFFSLLQTLFRLFSSGNIMRHPDNESLTIFKWIDMRNASFKPVFSPFMREVVLW